LAYQLRVLRQVHHLAQDTKEDLLHLDCLHLAQALPHHGPPALRVVAATFAVCAPRRPTERRNGGWVCRGLPWLCYAMPPAPLSLSLSSRTGVVVAASCLGYVTALARPAPDVPRDALLLPTLSCIPRPPHRQPGSCSTLPGPACPACPYTPPRPQFQSRSVQPLSALPCHTHNSALAATHTDEAAISLETR
jgi:hypothetical protein